MKGVTEHNLYNMYQVLILKICTSIENQIVKELLFNSKFKTEECHDDIWKLIFKIVTAVLA